MSHKYAISKVCDSCIYKQFTQALPGSNEQKFGACAAILCGERRDRTILGEWLPGVRYLEVKMYVKARWGREKCPLFGV